MKKKLSLFVVFAIALILALGGCGSNTNDNAGNTQNAGDTAQSGGQAAEVANIKVAIVATGNVPVDFQKQIDRFNGSHDNVKVEILTFSSGDAYNQALMGQIAGGVAPDVFVIDGGVQMAKFAKTDAILPLDDLAKAAGIDKSNFYDSLIQVTTIDGKIYGIPKDYNTTALFYHKDMLETAGVKPPTTWDELLEAAKTLTKDGVYGFGINPQINYFYPFIKSAGANFVEPDGVNKDKIVTPEHKNALNYLLSLFNKDKVATSPQMVAAGWDGEMFGNKKVAMLYGGTWIPGVLLNQNPNLQIGAVPLPVKNEKASMIYMTGWVISSKSKHPDAAMELIKFLTSDDEIVAGNKAGLIGLPPTKTSMAKLKEEQKGDSLLSVYEDIVNDSIPFGWIEPRFVDSYNKMLEGLIYKPGEKTVEEALNNLIK